MCTFYFRIGQCCVWFSSAIVARIFIQIALICQLNVQGPSADCCLPSFGFVHLHFTRFPDLHDVQDYSRFSLILNLSSARILLTLSTTNGEWKREKIQGNTSIFNYILLGKSLNKSSLQRMQLLLYSY